MARQWLGTRLFSIAALCGTVCGLGYLAKNVYHLATDSFVVPVVLSPDSELVISSKLSRAGLTGERMKATAKKEQLDAELEAADQAIEELKVLRSSVSRSLEWTSAVTVAQATTGASNLRALGDQQGEITSMVSAQEALVAQMKKELDVGLLSKADYAREQHSLGQMRVAAIENHRARIASGAQMNQLALTQQAIRSGRAPGGISTPEMLSQQDQLVRIKCDMIKLEAERRAKAFERRNIAEELTKLDELLGQLNQRPIFRAIDASTNIAFIPYSQLEGVAVGGKVYECVIGMFSCTPVGKVSEVLPGEVIVPDPWGSLARGQYAVIQLDDQHAAQSKTLRVRPGTKVAPASPAASTPRLASK
jgi:hypothetical protein